MQERYLVARLSSMGDVVLTTAFVRRLAAACSEAQIDLLTDKKFKEIYEFNPRIKNLIEYDKSLSQKELNDIKTGILRENGRYDAVFDLHNNLRTAMFLSGIGKQIFKIRKRRLHKLSLVYLKKSPYEARHITELHLETGKNFGVETDEKGLEIWLPEEKRFEVYPPENREKSILKNPKIALAPGAFHFTKRYPPEKFARLADELQTEFAAEIILLGGTKDAEICREIVRKSSAKITDRSGAKSILDTASLVDSCDALVSNDTGAGHIAAAREVPTAVIFGSTVPEFGFTPYGRRSAIIQSKVPCRPCTHIGRSKCPKRHFQCMGNITVSDIKSALKKILF